MYGEIKCEWNRVQNAESNQDSHILNLNPPKFFFFVFLDIAKDRLFPSTDS